MTERNKEPFLDWFAIWPGATGYDADGAAFISEAPAGVELAVQQPTITEPVVVSDKPWEGKTLGTSTVLVEDGTYRLWYSADCGMCYAESPDGFNWEKPELNILEIDGSTANNVVYGRGVAGNIFRDPSAPDAERYKLVDLDASWVHEGKDIPEEEALRLREELMKMTATQEELAAKLSIRGQVTGAVSPDGLRWEVIKEPLFVKFCDTQNVVLYDPERKKYIGYWRDSAGRRRSVARSETEDFRHWPQPDLILSPDSQDAATDDYYNNAYSPYPDKKDLHLMFPSVYRRVRDTVEVQIAVSRDERNWSWPSRTPIISDSDDYPGGIYTGPGIIPLANDRWGLICECAEELHNVGYYMEPDRTRGEIRWALWQRDRLVALEAQNQGQVTTNKLECSGESLVLNYRTAPNGWIRVALIAPTLWPPARLDPMEGYGYDECEPLRGDSLETEVRWKGDADLSFLKGQEICLRIELCQAELFSLAL